MGSGTLQERGCCEHGTGERSQHGREGISFLRNESDNKELSRIWVDRETQGKVET